MASATAWPLARLALEWLPPWYVEEFEARSQNVEVVTPERKTIHTGFLSDVQSRFVTARYVAEGARLNIYQHGSGYGEIEGFELHDTESFMADEFMTWGWRIRPNDVPFLALRFMRPTQERLRPKRGRAEWLYVNQRSTFPWEVKTTLDVQDRFFGGLTESIAKQGILRPRMEKGGGWESQIAERARRLVKHVDDGESNFNELASSVGLVVFDAFPSTSFLECMQAGQPAIVIASEPVEFSQIAKPIYEEFIEMGLLHLTPESAVEFVNGLAVQKWWKSVEQKACLREYVRLFCRTSLKGTRD
jgi:putative transferase (TIGR04331 family)